MKLLMLGPPAVGKSTQTRSLARVLSYFHVSTGDVIRAHIQAGTDLGREVEGYTRRGELVPDELVLKMVFPNLEPAGRWILDGFPRTLDQALALDRELAEIGLHVTQALLLEAPDRVLAGRIKGRRYSEATGWTYHLEHAPPPQPEQHLDPGPFVRREDDDPEVFRRQLAAYHEEIGPLAGHYESQGLLTRIDGDRRPEEVTKSILRALGFDERAAEEKGLRRVCG
ncbi:adk: adenylate kinase [Rubrobacter radiotolerans]|uniref:Adenylate kinase n=1 Tax=Rubrobacter radiotolerans TaxID=42256 RepID=A0A023X742_RUBRA|nr:nucleoside monophosphate kinase [Rubrobacter radiotolerans]AHY47850.1 adk: adenylate kinase [Rubrobacter radiotolerans]MDX5892489.1 nucleoside monophosphate kinase [Rubrobacter radiotolerans]SMC07780.1 Adenylate kinase [Rubrobacter radiotolerans DSM 5868]